MTAAAARTWRHVAVAAMVGIIIAAVAVGGSLAFLFFRHVRSEEMPVQTADARLAEARARFGAQPALLRIDADGDAVLAGRSDAGGAPAPVAALRVLAYDSGQARLTDISIPFWLLRLAPNGRISFDSGSGSIQLDAERLHLNVAALEALGPGLVLDHVEAAGMKILIWTE
jgi:hypothetical protein